MTYRVIYTNRVQQDIQQQIEYLRSEKTSPQTIELWFSRLFDAFDGLYEFPKRYPVDAALTERYGFEVRKIVFNHYLIHYRVITETRRVHLLSFQHGSRRR